jgi:endonuclease-3
VAPAVAVAIKIDGLLFVHGGISPAVAPWDARDQDQVKRELTSDLEKTRANALASLTAGRRTLVVPRPRSGADLRAAADRDPVEARMCARSWSRTPWTPLNRITTRFDGRVIEIDTACSPRYIPDGRASALEIRAGKPPPSTLDRAIRWSSRARRVLAAAVAVGGDRGVYDRIAKIPSDFAFSFGWSDAQPSAEPFTPSCARWTRHRSARSARCRKDRRETARKTPFEVLISTMLSAQTRDSGHRRGVRAALPRRAHAEDHGEADDDADRAVIYPSASIATKRSTSKRLPDPRRALSRPRAGDDGGAADLPGGTQDRQPGAHSVVQEPARTSVSIPRASDFEPSGWYGPAPRGNGAGVVQATARSVWPFINLYLVTWGQNVCRPVYPRCGACVIREHVPADWRRTNVAR